MQKLVPTDGSVHNTDTSVEPVVDGLMERVRNISTEAMEMEAQEKIQAETDSIRRRMADSFVDCMDTFSGQPATQALLNAMVIEVSSELDSLEAVKKYLARFDIVKFTRNEAEMFATAQEYARSHRVNKLTEDILSASPKDIQELCFSGGKMQNMELFGIFMQKGKSSEKDSFIASLKEDAQGIGPLISGNADIMNILLNATKGTDHDARASRIQLLNTICKNLTIHSDEGILELAGTAIRESGNEYNKRDIANILQKKKNNEQTNKDFYKLSEDEQANLILSPRVENLNEKNILHFFSNGFSHGVSPELKACFTPEVMKNFSPAARDLVLNDHFMDMNAMGRANLIFSNGEHVSPHNWELFAFHNFLELDSATQAGFTPEFIKKLPPKVQSVMMGAIERNIQRTTIRETLPSTLEGLKTTKKILESSFSVKKEIMTLL